MKTKITKQQFNMLHALKCKGLSFNETDHFAPVPLGKLNIPQFPFHELEQFTSNLTIFDKILLSNITRKDVSKKLVEIRKRVMKRSVLLNLPDNEVLEYWFKNWLHPRLIHVVEGSTYNDTEALRERNSLNLYENGQQNYSYSIDDVIKWCAQ